MHRTLNLRIIILLTVLVATANLGTAAATRQNRGSCRYLPGDDGWPCDSKWAALNRTVGGRLIRGVPIGQPCYGNSADPSACSEVQKIWTDLPPFFWCSDAEAMSCSLEDPVNVISFYFESDTCSPFYGPFSVDPTMRNATCSQGRLAPYAIDVRDAAAVVAGVNFARKNNIRLIIKNTGHDILGRSTGPGSLALWTHNLKDSSFFTYRSQYYTGPAARIGAGVQVQELYEAAAANGYRVTGGGCPTVGAAGGWVQSGGHGPLSATYGLGADTTLEFEVVTADGRQLTASRTENADLFWALSGGGPGNYAVVVSATLKVFSDGPVAGSRLTFMESDPDKYFRALEAWQKHLLFLDTVPGFQSSVTLLSGVFSLSYVTLPDRTAAELTDALTPFYQELTALGIEPTVNETMVHDTFLEHYLHFEAASVYSRNITVGNRIIPRSLVADDARLPQLTEVYKEILDNPNAVAFVLAGNLTHERVGNAHGDNPVIHAWRDSLFITNFGLQSDELATAAELEADLATVNEWQKKLRDITPGGGSYMNEATHNFAFWKTDYYGEWYDDLVRVKNKYDPGFVLWNQPGAGHDAWREEPDGRLCKV
ncbi:6-hydroxy-D-nicotine oxidase [Madurella mycetomatis]|uniref:6-hydroxy-D-nicotine oxidase n=1 Tax=Madurella mycetomatis TaxID=100816 RepID=A0A175WBV9_9PEZI|nr:6-hydroxy-D-nicotine oxidase [Madurella mycetomatis]